MFQKKKRRKIDRSMIGEPMNFVHLTHVGSGEMAGGMPPLGSMQHMRSKGHGSSARNDQSGDSHLILLKCHGKLAELHSTFPVSPLRRVPPRCSFGSPQRPNLPQPQHRSDCGQPRTLNKASGPH
ncbi:hypothetical protein Z043_101141 [Scleropages formosus]|uniref:CRIB domain-containing protein n=1 Tax=Scleropages formosus TaxID=113540 RepID=A0A0P7XVF7_SCLFO|nr:hypothetical protein Z043_101141 [Scleropages formosus]